MKKALEAIAAVAILTSAPAALATPSTVFWTPATTYTQPFLVPHLTYDTYFAELGAYPVITGVTVGVIPSDVVLGEVGFDLFYPGKGKAALLLNGKLTLAEDKLFAGQPGLSVGIMNVGFEKDVNDYDMLHVTLGKALSFGTLAVGGYYGLGGALFRNAAGEKEQAGVMASYVTPDIAVGLRGLEKVNFFGDVQTGKNVFGAWGLGVGLYFTPAIDLLMGPVFFNESALQPGGVDWMWTMQIDVDVDFARK